MDPLVGKVLEGRYRFTRLIGEGRSSTVYEAEELATDRHVALRLLHFQAAWEPYLGLRHENIIPTYAAGQTADGLVFLASELVRAPRLHHVIASNGALPWQRSLEILIQLCNALHAANAHDIAVALSPEKIYLEPFDVVRVDVGPHMPGQTMGPYGRSDVYDIGVLAHEMLANELPPELAPPFVGDPRLEVPAELEPVVISCLRERLADVSAVRDGLLAIRAAVRTASAT